MESSNFGPKSLAQINSTSDTSDFMVGRKTDTSRWVGLVGSLKKNSYRVLSLKITKICTNTIFKSIIIKLFSVPAIRR